jgi:hypothetical protein
MFCLRLQVIEKLYRLRWGAMDGIGAVIISPTRELAMQIFDELRKVGKHHSLSGGLLIGGRKGVETEKETVAGLNILVCTPGRLLQHMDETPNFDCSQLQVSLETCPFLSGVQSFVILWDVHDMLLVAFAALHCGGVSICSLLNMYCSSSSGVYFQCERFCGVMLCSMAGVGIG